MSNRYTLSYNIEIRRLIFHSLVGILVFILIALGRPLRAQFLSSSIDSDEITVEQNPQGGYIASFDGDLMEHTIHLDENGHVSRLEATEMPAFDDPFFKFDELTKRSCYSNFSNRATAELFERGLQDTLKAVFQDSGCKESNPFLEAYAESQRTLFSADESPSLTATDRASELASQRDVFLERSRNLKFRCVDDFKCGVSMLCRDNDCLGIKFTASNQQQARKPEEIFVKNGCADDQGASLADTLRCRISLDEFKENDTTDFAACPRGRFVNPLRMKKEIQGEIPLVAIKDFESSIAQVTNTDTFRGTTKATIRDPVVIRAARNLASEVGRFRNYFGGPVGSYVVNRVGTTGKVRVTPSTNISRTPSSVANSVPPGPRAAFANTDSSGLPKISPNSAKQESGAVKANLLGRRAPETPGTRLAPKAAGAPSSAGTDEIATSAQNAGSPSRETAFGSSGVGPISQSRTSQKNAGQKSIASIENKDIYEIIRKESQQGQLSGETVAKIETVLRTLSRENGGVKLVEDVPIVLTFRNRRFYTQELKPDQAAHFIVLQPEGNSIRIIQRQ